jgi:SOS-response transcriptional repressor LexA
MPSAALITLRHGEYVVLELALPGRPVASAGVLLFDASEGACKLRTDWESIADSEDVEVLSHLEDDLKRKLAEMPASRFVDWLEDTLSNVLRAGQRRAVTFRRLDRKLERLFEEEVMGAANAPASRYVTHLPLYSLQAAATKFGEDMEVAEQGWVCVPGLRLTKDMFVAHVVGRSMEPRIPDGSLCVFRAGVVGTRQGKLLLIQRAGASETGGEFTIKRYRSTKKATEDGWEHTAIRLEPLNPEFGAWELLQEQFRVIGEFIKVLEEE